MTLPAKAGSSLADTMALLKGARNQYARNAGRPVTLKEGKTRVRIIKSPTDPKFWRDVGQHWIKADENGKPLAVCGSTSTTFPDAVDAAGAPIVDLVADAVEAAVNAATDDTETKLYKNWRARKFVLVQAVILSGPDAAPTPKLLQLSGGAFSDFLAVAEEYGESGMDVFDPKTGVDMQFERRGKGLDTEYTVMAAAKSEPLDPKIVEQMTDIDGYIQREYFRQGDDRKVLNAIRQIAGVSSGASTAALPAAAPRAGALTGPAARIASLTSPITEASAATPTPAPVAAVVEEDEDERIMREAQERLAAKKAAAAQAQQAAAQLATQAAPAAKPAATPAPAADNFGAELNEADLDATLAELDNLG